MEFTEEFIKEQGLSEEQVKGITSFTQAEFATKQKEWEGKANDNAEGIIDGAIKSIQTEFGLDLERKQGEKAAQYLTRFSSSVVSGKQSELETLKADYEEKIKGVKGSEALSKEFEKMKEEKEAILEKYADYDALKEQASKADIYSKELSGLKLEVAFNEVKPTFPETVNKYEAKAIWSEFKAEVLEGNTIEIVEGVPKAIDKENHYKSVNLEELVSKNEKIQKLLEGRQQQGLNGKPVDLKTVEGVPFDVPAGADHKQITLLIRAQIAKEGLSPTSAESAARFKELNDKITQKKV
jgi:hypothetical protein